MKCEEMRKLIESITKNDFKHVQKYEEQEFTSTDKEHIKLTEGSEELSKQLFENIPEEYKKILDDYIDAVLCEWDNLCLFYFKKGLRAGLDNLNFIKEIDGIEAKYVL